ncbi:MAG: hypothetical protein A4S12_13275 [Proteobacteria bacterium SG_bin5]|nr:hypothetical protein [Sphingomonas sp.]OQW44894.1 MAG: hypothetical protein A4S12_13275 [Proteobacteria bacterium SG_bin5]
MVTPRPMLLDEFTPLLGKEFRVDCTPAEVPLVLTEAYPIRDSGLADRPPFMLIFRSPPEAVLITGGYVMRCGGWGPEIIHIEQVAALKDAEPGHYYQAVFN